LPFLRGLPEIAVIFMVVLRVCFPVESIGKRLRCSTRRAYSFGGRRNELHSRRSDSASPGPRAVPRPPGHSSAAPSMSMIFLPGMYSMVLYLVILFSFAVIDFNLSIWAFILTSFS